MNAPSASADGFSGKLGGNPLAWRLKASSWPRSKVRPHEHDPRGRYVAVCMIPAIAGMQSLGQRLTSDRAAFRARLACATRIDQLQRQPQEERARIPLSASADSPLRAITMGGKRYATCSQCSRRIVAWRSGGSFKRHGVRRPGADHDLCQRCWKALHDRARTQGYEGDADAMKEPVSA